MAIRIVRLGSARAKDEGLRVGTVRRPPRGVPKARFSKENWYDVWLPNLAPSAALFSERSTLHDDASWQKFVRRYRTEMSKPEASRLLDVLAALSHQTNFAVGCYCDDEARCHRSVLRRLLEDRGAAII